MSYNGPAGNSGRQWARAEMQRLGITYIATMDDFLRPTSGRPANATSGTASSPTAQLEPMPSPWSDTGPTVNVDRYALNPAVVWVRAVAPNAGSGQPPTMFNTGDLPLFTSSGIDPSQLAYVPWRYRHWAALGSRREAVLRMVEEADGLDYPDTSGAESAYRDYLRRVFDWATSNAESDQPGAGYDLVSLLLHGPAQ